MSGFTQVRVSTSIVTWQWSTRSAVHAAALFVCLAPLTACRDDEDASRVPTGPVAQQVVTGNLAWRTVPSPNRGSFANELRDIAIVSATDIWAVGEWKPTSNPIYNDRKTLIERWNGTSWQLVPSPNATWTGVDLSTLEAVAAVSSNSVWAVGHADDFTNLKSTTLIMRWNGSAWSIVPSRNPAGPDMPNRLFDLVILAPNDIWAVGEQNFPHRALILHWNGSTWSTVPNSCGGSLHAVTAVSSTTLWAVGEATTCRFNGQSWMRVPPPAEGATLLDVSGTSPTSVWAVGRIVFCGAKNCWSESRIVRWTGTQWTNVAHPPLVELIGVDAVAGNDVWALGDSASGAAALRWNGTQWTKVPVPQPGLSSSLNAVAADGAARTWAVGTFWNGSSVQRTWTITR